jgi:dihydroneopterin aldolase
MGETYAEPVLASYEREVAELIEAGEPFGVVEDAIEQVAELTETAKAALWLLAFSLQKPDEQVRAARAHLASVG